MPRISRARQFKSINTALIIPVSKSKDQLFLFFVLPTPILAVLPTTSASGGIGLHQLLGCHFLLPLKQAIKMET